MLEDSEWTIDALRAEGFSEAVLEAVDGLTRRPGEVYLDFCRRAAENEIARTVKLADLEDNLDPDRIAALPEANRSLAERYRKARAILLEGR